MSDDNDTPSRSFFSFGGFEPDEFHKALAEMAANCLRWNVEEVERVYLEQEAVAEEWNRQLSSEDLSPQACIAGIVRNSCAGRTAKRLSKSIGRFDPEKAHHYQARYYEHHAAFERWQGKLGKLTQLEHTHAPDAPHPPDGKPGDDDQKTPLPDWLRGL